jgi:hypothetical protein
MAAEERQALQELWDRLSKRFLSRQISEACSKLRSWLRCLAAPNAVKKAVSSSIREGGYVPLTYRKRVKCPGCGAYVTVEVREKPFTVVDPQVCPRCEYPLDQYLGEDGR